MSCSVADGDVVHEARRHRPVGEDAHRLAGADGGDDLVDAALGRTAAEQALDAQDVGARRLEREPLAEQLRHAVGAERPARVGFDVRTVGRAVEDEVGAVVNQRRAGRVRRAGERLDGERIAGERRLGGVFRRLDIVVGRAVDDDVRERTSSSREHRRRVGEIELGAREREDVAARRQPRDDGGTELTGGAGHHDPRHSARVTATRAAERVGDASARRFPVERRSARRRWAAPASTRRPLRRRENRRGGVRARRSTPAGGTEPG